MKHTHTIDLAFLPGIEPREVNLTHSHGTKPEEPHKHRQMAALHTGFAHTIPERDVQVSRGGGR